MLLYQKFRNSSLDTTPLGITAGRERSDSVFTPAGARIVAWIEYTGIHFCQVTGFADMVFAVDPAATPGDCVHPVASNMLDFISLLCACRDASLIAQSYQWSKVRFEEKIAEIQSGTKARSVLRALQNTYHPPIIADPYSYISEIQRNFDYSQLPLHPDYFEWCPIRPGMLKWEVGFNTDFADYCEKGKAGKELPLNRCFQWHGENWYVPAIYLCESGIVVDSYLEVPGEKIDRFMEKWGSREGDNLSIEEQMRCELDYPLNLDIEGILSLNGKTIPVRKSFTCNWNPRIDNSWKTRRVLEHYGLDREKGYLLRREFFQRKGKNPPIRTMELTLSAEPVSVPGQRFTATNSGESISFVHPATAQVHKLTVLSQTREALDPNFLSNHPCCYTKLVYSLEPTISKDAFSIVDCDPGDPWSGSNDGPTALFFGGKTPSAGSFALSSLRYTPAEQITWRMVFRQKLRQDISVKLLP